MLKSAPGHSQGGRIDQRPISGDDLDLGAAVRAGVDEVRYRNGLAVAWLRVGLLLLTLALAAVAYQVALGLRTGVDTHFLVAAVLSLAACSLAATVAGARQVELAARRALDAVAGQQARAPRDELARANSEIAAHRDQLVAARQQAVTLTQLIVHDLRNPLSAILQFISLAGTRVRGHGGLRDVEEDLRLAGEEGERLAAMVGDLLLLSQLETGTMRTRPQPVPIRPLLETAARSIEPRAADRRVTLSIRGDPDLVARCDLDLVRRLLDNLLANALRHVRPGDRIELEGVLHETELCLAVRNSGPPVPEEARLRLFEKQGPDPGRRWQHPGLGLYLCRLVAEAHGGRMVLAEAPGWPVAFEAWLPGACP